MPRLIDAEAFAEKVYRAWDLWEKKENDCFVFSDIITPMLISMPTVDAVKVVRCKDCKWWKTKYMRNGERKVCVIEAFEPVRNEEEYCSWAERKEDAD